MASRVWIFQYPKDVTRLGKDQASWYVGWYFQGKRKAKSCGKGARGHNAAEKQLRRIQSELDTGLHREKPKKRWEEFVEEYTDRILENRAVKTRLEAKQSLKNFKKTIKPGLVENITTQVVDEFVAKRRSDRGRKPKSTLAPATINKDLRHLKAALRIAHDWGYLPELPKIRMLREQQKIPRFVTTADFAAIYSKACPNAKIPSDPQQRYTPAQWWKALVVVAYMTGLRISEILALKWTDIDLDAGKAFSRADDNKGKREEELALHKVVIEHLTPLRTTDNFVFHWPHDPRTLRDEFGRVQSEAGIHLACRGKHEHTASCHVYGFHDFRRAFATVNAPRMKPEVLQKLMRHKSYQTTLGYVNLASQVEGAVLDMPVPDVLKRATDGPETAAG